MSPVRFSARRWALLLPPGSFFGFALLLVVGAPDLGGRLFAVALSLVTGYWLVRSYRAEVEISDLGVALRGQLRTRQLAWQDIDSAVVVQMRTASPFAGKFPYVSVGIRTVAGATVRFDDLAAPGKRPDYVQTVVDAINGSRPSA